MLKYGKVLDGRYSIEFLQSNRPSTLLTLQVETPFNTEIKQYLVGYTDNWRPAADMLSLEKVLQSKRLRTQFTRLVWWWREYCGFDWQEFVREGGRGGSYPYYPISELIGREL